MLFLRPNSAPRRTESNTNYLREIERATRVMGSTEHVAELISSLEQATLMAKQIGTAVEQNHLLQISSSLHIAHHRLSAFLSESTEKSLSSVEPMQLGEEEETAEDERGSAVEKVEEKMRECFIRNKRPKRPLSPSSAAAEERIGRDYGFDIDPNATKLRAFDLIYQFHG